MSAFWRAVVLVGLMIVAVTLWFWPPAVGPDDEARRLTWIATASQLGIVGYRDPAGAISPDGGRIAYAEGRHVRVVPAGGGVAVLMAAADGQVRHLAWHPSGNALVAEDTAAAVRWWRLAVDGSGRREPLWPDRVSIDTTGTDGTPASVQPSALRQVAWSPDGAWLVGTAAGREGTEVWRIAVDGAGAEMMRPDGRASWPIVLPSGELACVISREGRSRLSIPCGQPVLETTPDVDVIGPLAASPDGATIYFASPNDRGMVDLWSVEPSSGIARRRAVFDRDSYAPSVAADGAVTFHVQSYRTHVAEVALGSGLVTQLAAFQSETPSYNPTGDLVAVTFGTWRRVLDDANYPDIAQEIGVIDTTLRPMPLASPSSVIAESDSEDQAMAWSPNGRWIALHSHREQSDDIWLRPADGSAPDRRITFLGRGAEVGWPRWSPDGSTVLLDGASPDTGRPVMFVIGVDQETGAVTSDLREIQVEGFDGDVTHAEWLDSRTVVAIGKEGPGRQAVIAVPSAGGFARVVHRFASEHDFPGLAAAPDGTEVAFVAPAPDGYFQIFRLPAAGGAPRQVTTDPGHKSQPAWSPDGERIAFTVWSYQSQFWSLRP